MNISLTKLLERRRINRRLFVGMNSSIAKKSERYFYYKTAATSIGLIALCALFLWPLAYTAAVAQQNAVAVRANAIAQCVGEVEMRKVQKTCEQQKE